jgi:hypothetical protein
MSVPKHWLLDGMIYSGQFVEWICIFVLDCYKKLNEFCFWMLKFLLKLKVVYSILVNKLVFEKSVPDYNKDEWIVFIHLDLSKYILVFISNSVLTQL